MMRCLMFLVVVLVFTSAGSNKNSASDNSGIIYVVRHAETSGHNSTCGINAKGEKRARYMTTIFKGQKFETPKTIIAAQVPGKLQRMQDTVTPLAANITMKVTKGPTLIDDPDWTPAPAKAGAKQALVALGNGTVLLAWWSYIEELCKQLGEKCDNFDGFDEVLVVTVKNSKVESMKKDHENFPG